MLLQLAIAELDDEQIGQFRSRGFAVLRRAFDAEAVAKFDEWARELVNLPTQPGDIIFFDSYVPHASQPNMTERMRRIYYATYNRASAGDLMDRYYADKHKSFPPDIDRDPSESYVFRV